MILAQLRRRAARATALLLGVLIATTGFTVLTGSTATSRLQVVGEVEANSRAAYDILVRPPGSRMQLEQDRGLVRPNFVSGQFGGIGMDQYEQIAQLAGVEVAAPVAMIGYVTAQSSIEIDLTDAVDPSLQRQVLRVDRSWTAARGLTTLDEDARIYVYVTRNEVVWPVREGSAVDDLYSDQQRRPEMADRCLGYIPSIEILPDGQEVPLCQGAPDEAGFTLHVARLNPDGTFDLGEEPTGRGRERLTIRLQWPLTLLLAAIDPAAEADLLRLDEAVTDGRYLTAQDRAVIDDEPLMTTAVPVLTTTTPFWDETLAAGADRLAGAAVDALPGAPWADARAALDQAGGLRTVVAPEYSAADAYRTLLGDVQETELWLAQMHPIVQSSEPSYDVATDGTLTPQPIDVEADVFADPLAPGLSTLWLLGDGGFRPLEQARPHEAAGFLIADWIGSFDPAKLATSSDLATVPMETYFPPQVTGADDRSRELLGDRQIEPDSNPASYLATPPQMLTSLSAFPGLVEAPVPLSAIRVRVAGVEGFDDISRERVRVVAEAIAAATGLDVDITIGSSPAPQTVNLAGGNYGRPDLRLTEQWSKLGTAAAIIQAIDRKSVILFGLILVVCVLFLGNAVSAAVRDRRRELAVLSCLGWSRRRLATLVASETLLVGLLAGAVSTALALPLSGLIGVRLTVQHAMLAIPVAAALSLFAALVPALRAGRTYPAAAVVAAAQAPRRRRVPRRRTVMGLAAANLWRVPGRTVVAAAALGIGVGAVTILSMITWAFHGSVTGTLLGDAISLQVRGVDTVAVVATALLGAAAVADVLYLNIRDRAAELAALRATGWSAGALARLVTYEGIGIGLIGAIAGGASGIVFTTGFAGTTPPGLVWVTASAVAAGLLLTALAALIPALLQRRIPVQSLLAEE